MTPLETAAMDIGAILGELDYSFGDEFGDAAILSILKERVQSAALRSVSSQQSLNVGYAAIDTLAAVLANK